MSAWDAGTPYEGTCDCCEQTKLVVSFSDEYASTACRECFDVMELVWNEMPAEERAELERLAKELSA